MQTTTPIKPETMARADIRKAAATMTDDEARYLVDYYYICQDDRKRANNQVRAMADEPNAVLAFLGDQATSLEGTIKKALDDYTNAHAMGSWMREVYGIGPVLSAGLLAHIDIERAPTAGHIWAYAGLDPTKKWEKGQKRPHNAALKTLCWKVGQSFMKFSGAEECVYGAWYRHAKARYVKLNESGAYAEQAAALLPKFAKTTEAHGHLSAGNLPPAQIDARARRWAVKLFLAHMHGEWHQRHYGRPAPLPYAIAFGGHAHVINAGDVPKGDAQ